MSATPLLSGEEAASAFSSCKITNEICDAKMVVVGNTAVGKTCLIMRLATGNFSIKHQPTIGGAYLDKQIEVEGHPVHMKLWDTAGSERFRSMLPMYYRNTQAALIVYDVANTQSFDDVKIWVEELRKYTDEHTVIAIVGNKSDLANRLISQEEAANYSKSINAMFAETSAKTSSGVEQLFVEICRKVNCRPECDRTVAHVQVQTEVGARRPVNICCIIDVSGSMNDEAVLPGKGADTEVHGLSVLDIVKHSVKTIIQTLSPHDSISIVSYSTNAKIELPLTVTDDAGKETANRALMALVPEGQTNLWEGLKTGLDIMREAGRGARASSIMLLTDGMPNIVPPGGHFAALAEYRAKYTNIPAVINTFGFGYTLDSKLLIDLAVEGNGSYAFIPDSSFVGTIFVNSLSNLLATMATEAQLLLHPLNGATIVGIPGITQSSSGTETVDDSPHDVQLDLVFIVDCTGSMSSYIREAQQNIKSIVTQIVTSERADVRFGLVSYRDHPPQDSSYITKVFPFCSTQAEMKDAVDTMSASGGGDGPEALATGMRDAARLEFRPAATKVAVLITDAPPHGLGESGDGFPDGEPNGVDPLAVSREMAAAGIALYSVGCEPAIVSCGRAVAFMRAIAQMANGGKYIPLRDSRLLSTAIIGSCREELCLYRSALAILNAYQANHENVEATVAQMNKEGVFVTTLNFEDPDATRYASEVEAFISSPNLGEARSKLKSVSKPASASAGSATVKVAEGEPITPDLVRRVVKRYMPEYSKLVAQALAAEQRAAQARAQAALKRKGLQADSRGCIVLDHIGSLQYGQTKDVVVLLDHMPSSSPYLEVTLRHSTTSAAAHEVAATGTRRDAGAELVLQECRARLVDVIGQAMEAVETGKGEAGIAAAQDIIKQLEKSFLERLETLTPEDSPKLDSMIQDIQGQITEATSRIDWYTRWGVHFLPSLARAHSLQLCNNFKDPGVQQYGGAVFSEQRDAAEAIFIKQPAPPPSLLPPKVEPASTATAGTYTASSPSYEPAGYDMSCYYDSCSGCVSSGSLVFLDGGAKKPACCIRKGDVVLTSLSGETAEVKCVVKMVCETGVESLVQLSGGLGITSYHPVHIRGEWVFPCQVEKPTYKPCDAVYSFVLESNSRGSVVVGGIECASLAHGIVGDRREHAYFGTAAVTEDLKKADPVGWQSGSVTIGGNMRFVRRCSDDLVCGLVPVSIAE
ncbi:Alpha-protein kinase vwkA [Pelomyxa schiedti]|nr:Alpha-protein kinase vwkA [Pelomyxa schiedti]